MQMFKARKSTVVSTMVALVTLFGCTTNVIADDLYNSAVKKYSARNYAGANADLEQFLKKSPNDTNALYYDALSLHQLGKTKEATAKYQRIIQLAPDSAAGANAKAALQALTPGARPSASAYQQSSGHAAASTASAAGAVGRSSRSEPEDMASLPDHANFYFQREPSGHMGVNLSINGHPIYAWFDTGAEAYFYKDQLVAAGVDINKAVSAGNARGWSGVPVPVWRMPADIKLGTLTRRVLLTFQEGSSNGNLIGQDMIHGYQYAIDDKGGRVDLKKSIEATAQKVDSMYDVPCKIVNGRDIISIEVNGVSIPAFIDTGASNTIISPDVADKCHIETTGSQQMSGVGGAFTVQTGTARIRFGPISKDFPIQVGGTAGSCIGQDFMAGWRFQTDRERGLVRFFH